MELGPGRTWCRLEAFIQPWLWLGAALAAVGCSDDSKSPAPDTGRELLPEGETCHPGAVVACAAEDTPKVRLCDADGLATVPGACPGDDGICHHGQCFVRGATPECFPGDIEGCVSEGGRDALTCNQSGTAFVPAPCVGPDGAESQCRKGACTACFPGAKRCQDDATVVECDADGAGWHVVTVCASASQVCTGRFCEELCERNVKFNSYIGCDYFAVDLDNAFVSGENSGTLDAQGAQFAVVVANPVSSPRPAQVVISQLEGGVVEPVLRDSFGVPFPTSDLMPGDLRIYRLPRRDVNGTTLAPLAYRVTSSVPVIAYQFNPLEDELVYSNDASLLLPAALLGSEYLVMTKEQMHSIARGYLTVVAVMPGVTTVVVTVNGPTQAGTAHEGAPTEVEIPHMVRGETRQFQLAQFDVLNIESGGVDADLTGSRILATQRVAVFGGSEGANSPNTARCVEVDAVIGFGVCQWDRQTQCRNSNDCARAGLITCCADHLEDQLMPVKTWGSRVLATKLWDRGQVKDEWRIMAGADGTRVTLVPPQFGIDVPILDKGEFFEFESGAHFEIVAADNKPISVGQFMESEQAPGPNVGDVAGAGDAKIGDPAFILPVPVEQFRRDFVVLVPAEYADNFINVTFPTGAALEVDGVEVPADEAEPFGSGAFSLYRERFAEPGAHTIVCSEPAGVIVYGWDQYVSYGYAGGMDLQDVRGETVFPGGPIGAP